MGDSSMSASELRARYGPGGSAADSELTASQLRARYGVASNKKSFSTGETSGAGGAGSMNILLLSAGVAVLAVVAFMLFGDRLRSPGSH